MDASLDPRFVAGVAGILGSTVGAYFVVQATSRRGITTGTATWLWFALVVSLAIFIYFPSGWTFSFWLLYGVLLPAGMRYLNRGQSSP